MNIVDAQNASLSGGVAVGAIAHLMLQPYGSLLIGSAAGILSTVGYQIIQVILNTNYTNLYIYFGNLFYLSESIPVCGIKHT